MFWGKWDLVIDEKWRLVIPSSLQVQIDNFVLFYEGDDGCVRIEKPPLNSNELEIDPASLFIVEVKVSRGRDSREFKRVLKRVSIPSKLRGSNSFYFGKKVTLVGKGKHIEIWPRP